MPVEFDTLSGQSLDSNQSFVSSLHDENGFYGQTFVATSSNLNKIEFAIDPEGTAGTTVDFTVMIATVRYDANGVHPDQVVYESALITASGDPTGVWTVISADMAGLNLVPGQEYAILFNSNAGTMTGGAHLRFATNPQNDAGEFIYRHDGEQNNATVFSRDWFEDSNPPSGYWGDIALRLSYADPITVVNFDATTYGNPQTYSEDGLTFTTPTHLHFDWDMDADGFPELHGHNGGSETIVITKTGGGSFSLIDMDTDVGGDVELIAYRLVSGSLVETGRMVITAGTTQVTFTAAFHNIDQVVWNSAYSGGGNMTVDNIRYTTGAVPPTNNAPDAPVDADAATADQLVEKAIDGTYTGLTLQSSDADGDTLTYSLTDDAGGRFRVDPVTGAVVATGAVNIDYENAPSSDANGRYYEVTGVATDPDGAVSGPTTYRIYVTNVVESPFTEGGDGSAAQPVDFNIMAPGAYEPDADAQYFGLGGDDYVILPDQATVASGRNPWDYARTFQAGDGNDMVQGGDGNDIVAGNAGNDRLFGDAGNDQLLGGTGNDVLGAGAGTDRLTGGEGRDVFLFTDSELGSSRYGAHDVITDFTQGTDLIDISALYDGGPFAGFKFGKLSSALKNGAPVDAYKVAYYGDGVSIWVQGDTTGDGIADFTIELTGARALAGTPAAVSASFVVNPAGWDSAMTGLGLDYDWASHHRDDPWL